MHRPPLRGISLALLVFSLGMAEFMGGLDLAIANVAIPTIAADFGVTTQEGTWLITLFAVSGAISLALTGWLTKRFGIVKVGVLSILAFTVTSFLCGAAWDFNSLLAFRILQGAFSGPLVAIPQTLMLANCPEDKKNLTLGIYLIILVLGPILGPVLGGWITEDYGWRWIFYINIPFGLISAIIVWELLKEREDEAVKVPLDILALCLMVTAIITLQVILDRGNDDDWLESNTIVVLAIISFVTGSLFIAWNKYSNNPVIAFYYMRERNFCVATLLQSATLFGLMGPTIIIPLYVQTQLGYTPLLAGLVVMPIGIAPLLITPIADYLRKYMGFRTSITISFVLFAWSSFMFSRITSSASFYDLFMLRFYQGLGVGFCFVPLLQLAMANVPPPGIPQATSVYHFIRLFLGGGGISTAVYVTLWQRRAALHHSNLTEVMTPLREVTKQTYEVLNGLGVNDQAAAVYFDYVVTSQAYTIAFNDLMWFTGWVYLLIIPFTWLAKEPKKIQTVLVYE